jgi:hypothetical protein
VRFCRVPRDGPQNDLGWKSMNRKQPAGYPWVLLLLVGCGSPGAPLPPSLNLPTPVVNLSAARVGDSVHLAWTMPKRNTDRVDLRHPVPAQVCRAVENGRCASIGKLLLAPGGAGEYTDPLPADLAQAPDRLLRYEVGLLNHAGKSAGPSNVAYSAAGASPPALTGLNGLVRQDGVLLNWQPAAEPGRTVLFRIERRELTATVAAEGPKSPLSPAVPDVNQMLEVHGTDGADPGHALDNSALLNRQYRYVVERVATLAAGGQRVEVQGSPSTAIVVTTTDVFPPAVPQGLLAVADEAAGAIDLSWSPNTDRDLAAYHVFRRDVDVNSPARQIASVSTEPSFRDTGVQAGHTYVYSVSAIDQNGRESKQCPEVQETLPAR